MTRRERNIAIVAGSLAGVGLLYKVGYPLLQPLLTIKDRIAELEAELADKLDERERIDDARLVYRKLVERTGGTNASRMANEVRAKLDGLLVQANLEDRKLTQRPTQRDSKTSVETVKIDLSGTGSLESTINFLKACYELPYVARFSEIKLSPQRSQGKKETAEKIKLEAVFEVTVLPEHKLAEVRPDLAARPESLVKHSGEPLAMIWERRPFDEYVKPAPPPRETVAQADPPPSPKTRPPPPKPEGDPDRETKRVAMTILYGIKELVIVNEKGRRGNDREYVAEGEKLDGGDLLAVHPYGGLVRKEKGKFFYPLGKRLAESVPVDQAVEYPELQELLRQLPPEALNRPDAETGENVEVPPGMEPTPEAPEDEPSAGGPNAPVDSGAGPIFGENGPDFVEEQPSAETQPVRKTPRRADAARRRPARTSRKPTSPAGKVTPASADLPGPATSGPAEDDATVGEGG